MRNLRGGRAFCRWQEAIIMTQDPTPTNDARQGERTGGMAMRPLVIGTFLAVIVLAIVLYIFV